MWRVKLLLGALSLVLPLSFACSTLHPPSAPGVQKQSQRGELSLLLSSARSVCVVAPSDVTRAEIVKKLVAWGRLNVVSRPDDADLILEMRRIGGFTAGADYDSEGYPFSASVTLRLSGIQTWSTNATSPPPIDIEGKWAARAIADEFVKYFDRTVPI